MPKKKLTKAQVRKKFKTLSNGMYDLILDKMGYDQASEVPMSLNKALEVHRVLQLAFRKV